MEPEIWIKPTGKMNTHWMCFMKFDDCPNCGAEMEES